MTAPPPAHVSGARGLRALLTDPAVPIIVLGAAVFLAVLNVPVLTWAITGGLAGYSLSGSV